MEVHVDDKTVEQIIKDLQEGGFEDHTRTGYLTGRIDGDNMYVDGIYVPEQESSSSLSTISAENKAKMYESLRESGKKIVGIGHYHAFFAVFESAMDQQIRQELPTEGIPAVALITNKKGDYQIFQ